MYHSWLSHNYCVSTLSLHIYSLPRLYDTVRHALWYTIKMFTTSPQPPHQNCCWKLLTTTVSTGGPPTVSWCPPSNLASGWCSSVTRLTSLTTTSMVRGPADVRHFYCYLWGCWTFIWSENHSMKPGSDTIDLEYISSRQEGWVLDIYVFRPLHM